MRLFVVSTNYEQSATEGSKVSQSATGLLPRGCVIITVPSAHPRRRSANWEVHLFTRRGYDWTDRYPGIAATAAKLRAKSFTVDGEAAVSDAAGIAVFEALRRRRAAPDAILHAFDLLELNGKDDRSLPLGERKETLARLLGGSTAGIVFNEHTDEDADTVFRHACRFGFEGIVPNSSRARGYLSRAGIRDQRVPSHKGRSASYLPLMLNSGRLGRTEIKWTSG
jgi:bifunctional non-homologous end joining protein LigD